MTKSADYTGLDFPQKISRYLEKQLYINFIISNRMPSHLYNVNQANHANSKESAYFSNLFSQLNPPVSYKALDDITIDFILKLNGSPRLLNIITEKYLDLLSKKKKGFLGHREPVSSQELILALKDEPFFQKFDAIIDSLLHCQPVPKSVELAFDLKTKLADHLQIVFGHVHGDARPVDSCSIESQAQNMVSLTSKFIRDCNELMKPSQDVEFYVPTEISSYFENYVLVDANALIHELKNNELMSVHTSKE